ncbi:MAG: flagellar basal body rod protein FlgB [Candidatus Sumerlaeota bacterium]|nr:flagellar basal body rod protein FlgB [Candidatus Sumerlaeota bacterium]
MIDGIFGRNLGLIEKALDIRMQRQQLLSSDVANIDTPGFRALDVDFKESLQRLISSEEAAQAEGAELTLADNNALQDEMGKPGLKVVGVDGMLIGPDSNSANMELLMGKIQENAMLYKVAAQIVSGRFQKLNSVLDEMAK